MRERKRGNRRRQEGGFALVLAIMALMLLTFLGLTLATTTSTELQIATNYKWSQQALYNAEAGIEVGKRYLRQIEWDTVVAPARPIANMTGLPSWTLARNGPNGEPSRNFENFQCDKWRNDPLQPEVWGGGYGVVLDDVTRPFPFQNVSRELGQSLMGTFTVWIRRPLETEETGANAGAIHDYDDTSPPDKVILVAEGTAPYIGVGAFELTNRAVRYLEVTLAKIQAGDCENRTAQAGSGPAGAGFDQCDPVRAEGILGGATEVSPTAQ